MTMSWQYVLLKRILRSLAATFVIMEQKNVELTNFSLHIVLENEIQCGTKTDGCITLIIQ